MRVIIEAAYHSAFNVKGEKNMASTLYIVGA